MIALAGELRWLTPAEQRRRARADGRRHDRAGHDRPSDIELFCSLNKDHRLDGERERIRPTAEQG
jgi:hypothetical protein